MNMLSKYLPDLPFLVFEVAVMDSFTVESAVFFAPLKHKHSFITSSDHSKKMSVFGLILQGLDKFFLETFSCIVCNSVTPMV